MYSLKKLVSKIMSTWFDLIGSTVLYYLISRDTWIFQ